MKNIVRFLFLVLVFTSCNSEEKPYSYLCDSETVAETVDLHYNSIDNTSAFEYTIQSREMCIHWGYATALNDYMFFGKNDSMVDIKPITHLFPSSGEYNIKIKTISLIELNLSKSNSNEITELNLMRCYELKHLYCVDQPISQLDLKDCPALTDLSCGYANGTQTLSDIREIKKLENLSINGPINVSDLNLSFNDSLKVTSFKKSNLINIQMTELKALTTIVIDSCTDFQNLSLSANNKLKQLTLTNNTSLDSKALNEIFSALPIAINENYIILLKGNKGDDSCDSSIASLKGWTVSILH